jgi:hypothetical protein
VGYVFFPSSGGLPVWQVRVRTCPYVPVRVRACSYVLVRVVELISGSYVFAQTLSPFLGASQCCTGVGVSRATVRVGVSGRCVQCCYLIQLLKPLLQGASQCSTGVGMSELRVRRCSYVFIRVRTCSHVSVRVRHMQCEWRLAHSTDLRETVTTSLTGCILRPARSLASGNCVRWATLPSTSIAILRPSRQTTSSLTGCNLRN